MGSAGLIRASLLLLVASLGVSTAAETPLLTSVINCSDNSDVHLPSVNENFTGVLEVVTGIPVGVTLVLGSRLYPEHLDYIELIHVTGEASATIRTTKPLHVETLFDTTGTLYYHYQCEGEKKFNMRALHLTDVNQSPKFPQELYNVTISEATEVNSWVLELTAKEVDVYPEFSNLTYSIVPESDHFEINNTGYLILKSSLNFNISPKYNFTVTAQDPMGLNDTATVLIHVNDIDNLNPYFSNDTYQAVIPENDEGPFKSILPEAIKAQDGDKGINMTVTYSISSVLPKEYEGHFSIDENSGVISVQTSFDREQMNSNNVVISIKAAQTDDAQKTAVAEVQVTVEDVNDSPPVFDQDSYSVTLLENSPNNKTVFKVIVTDADEAGFVGTLKISPESAPFTIDAEGTVRVKDSTALDRETNATITFQIEAIDTDPALKDAVPVVVTLEDENDNSPSFTNDSYKGYVFANNTVGDLLLTVEAEDGDADNNGQIKYSIDFGNQQNYFSIDETTGNMTLKELIPVEAHKTKEFFLVVTASDGGAVPLSTSVQVQITAVGDTKPQFIHDIYNVTTEEEIDPGTVILKVGFLAINETPVTLQVESEEHKEIFNINQNGELSTKKKLDYDEAPHNYSVNISITDGVHTAQAVVEVRVTDINDNSPVFNSMPVEVSVSEDAEKGFNVTAVSATDKDSGANGEIRYSLTGGEGRFVVHPESGMVTLAAGLDREVKAQYQLQVVAEDQGCPANTATASLLINVTDVNDNAPKFSQAEYQVQVKEDESTDTSLFNMSATDLDEGENAKVFYRIVHVDPSSGQDIFELDANLGTLKLAQPLLDYSVVKEYRLVVEASDGGTPSLVGNTSVVVKVTDVNNNPPEFDKGSYNVDVPENLASGVTILTVKVTDKDEDGFSNGHFSYTSDTFDINNQGIVSLKKDSTLDRETKDSYTIQVVAVDQPSGGLSATAVINISILDYNDNAPQFPTILEQFEIREGDYSEERPADIINMNPTDPDLGPNGEVTIAIFPTNPLFRFREDGTLMAVGSLDRESRDTHELVVTASDNGNPQRQSITAVTVVVTDINDNKPEFSSISYISSVLLKDIHPGKLVLTLEATDRDLGNNSLITYSFLGGGSPYLSLNSTSGAITLTSNVTGITENTVLELTAMAQDHGEPPLNDTVPVTIVLRVTIPESVAFRSSLYNFSVPENEPNGAFVGKVQASAESDLYSVSYSLLDHTDLFSVDTNGTIHTKAALDKELQDWYILRVKAEDTQPTPTTDETIVTVLVGNVNEPPQFHTNLSHGSVFSIVPFKTPIVTVTATDPDVGDSGRLNYSLVGDTKHFDVEPSSGLVYVVSVTDLAGRNATLEVKVSDPSGLEATTTVEVEVNGGANHDDQVVISINQPANRVDEKIRDVERALHFALYWEVHIVDVRSDGAVDTRSLNATSKTLISFISTDREQVVPSEDVKEKLMDMPAVLELFLSKVFGEDVDVGVENPAHPPPPTPPPTLFIALVVVLVVSLLLLIGAVALLIYLIMKKTPSTRQQKHASF